MTGQVRCACMRLNRLPSRKIVFVFSMRMYQMTVGKMRMELPDGFMESHGIVAWAHGIAANCCAGSWNRVEIDRFACMWEVRRSSENCIQLVQGFA